MHAPSGRQVVLVSDACGGQELVVVETGGGLRSYRAGSRDVLDGYPEDEMCSGGRGQPLVPWPNRLDGGRYTWRDRTYQLALSEPSSSTAIHGLTRWLAWEVTSATTSEATVIHRLLCHPGYPWELEASISYRLDEEGLTVRTAVVNRSEEPAPFGLGFHPYLSAGGGLVDDCTVTVAAATALDADERGLPAGSHPVGGTDDDFHTGRRIGDRHLDLTLTDLGRDDTGRSTVSLTTPDGDTTTVWADASFPFLQLYSGDTLGDEVRRRRGLAVEPMTGPADLLASGTGRITLDPGEPFSASWGIKPG